MKEINFDHKICDPRISRIEKILVKNCPKFLDFYASIYGMYLAFFALKHKLYPQKHKKL